MTGRDVGVAALVVAGLGVVGLGVFFAVAGLDDADKLASVIGVFVGLVGLGLSVYGIVLARRSPPLPGPAAPGGAAVGSVHNVFSGGTARDVYQAGNLTVDRGPATPPNPTPPVSPGPVPPAPPGP
ncbi:hypothetical protein ACIRL2_50230 [Embleya sp. NPDC127516]|uniref:hypothetical protein n=1 Tax=Embleya sp. NPDC127516 TaxID=3363990 RepID=UPI00382D8CA1